MMNQKFLVINYCLPCNVSSGFDDIVWFAEWLIKSTVCKQLFSFFQLTYSVQYLPNDLSAVLTNT